MDSKSADKFYTNSDVVEFCGLIYSKYVRVGVDTVVEPSAGAGAFGLYVDIMLDLYPERQDIIEQDFLKWDSSKYKFYLGNPPFGKNSSLAKKFFNHAAKGKGIIGFILPRTFRKSSVTNSLDLNFWLLEEHILDTNSFTLEGKPYAVPCVFQIWVKKDTPRVEIKNIKPIGFKYVKSSEPYDISFRRVGVYAGKCKRNDGSKVSVQSHHLIKFDDASRVDAVIERINTHVFPTNTVGPRSLSKNEINSQINIILFSF